MIIIMNPSGVISNPIEINYDDVMSWCMTSHRLKRSNKIIH